MGSVAEMEEERLVEDLEDLLLRPGGEPGASLAKAFISWQMAQVVMAFVRDGCRRSGVLGWSRGTKDCWRSAGWCLNCKCLVSPSNECLKESEMGFPICTG